MKLKRGLNIDSTLFQERQYIARRERDFEDALAREAEACRQAKIDYEEEVAHQQAIHEEMKKERERLRTEKVVLLYSI